MQTSSYRRGHRRWPALVSGVLLVVGAAVLLVQRSEINELQQSVHALALTTASAGPQSATPAPAGIERRNSTTTTETTHQEIARLKGVVSQFEPEVAQLEQTRAANDGLRRQLAQPAATASGPEDLAAVEKAKARVENTACINQLKQLGLAAKVWALDNGDVFPPDFRSMSNEISVIKLLVCPGNHSERARSSDWSSVSSADSDYQYLAPSAGQEEPNRVLFLCPIHGSVCLVDGSVQTGVANSHPEWLVQRDGKMYYQPPGVPTSANTAPQHAPEGGP